MRSCLATLALAFLAALPLQAACLGSNLVTALPAEERAVLEASARAVPFSEGNLWRATRDGTEIILAGTYHLDDPRHERTFALLAPELARVKHLLVEAGPQEEAALQAEMARNPIRIFDFSGPRLDEVLAPDDWQDLSAALLERGLPPPLALKMRPWYLIVMVAIPTCQMAEMAQANGLDRRLIDAALQQGISVTALEPWDTVFGLLDDVAPEEQLTLLTQSVLADRFGADLAVTMADLYFAGQSRLMWDFTRHFSLQNLGLSAEEIDRGMDLTEVALITKRNKSWIAPLEQAAADGPVLAAFGALHLPGEAGVLNLLAGRGWTVTPLAP